MGRAGTCGPWAGGISDCSSHKMRRVDISSRHFPLKQHIPAPAHLCPTPRQTNPSMLTTTTRIQADAGDQGHVQAAGIRLRTPKRQV